MDLLYSALRPCLFALPPETAHRLAIAALSCGILPSSRLVQDPALAQNIWNAHFPNPLGLAAGFDKNAEVINAMLRLGFGFVEAGTVTPKPQAGNDKPRVFRLTKDRAIINRLGFNNRGLERFVHNFSRRDRLLGIAGANIGKNKDMQDAARDYIAGMRAVYAASDYITINISSPNTQGLRQLQHHDALDNLLKEVCAARDDCQAMHDRRVPLVLKVAPDLAMEEKEAIAALAISHRLDGLMVSNTTISRPDNLVSTNRHQQGGLSGKPLFALSTQALKDFYLLTSGKLVLIGVGGVDSGEAAYAKIRAGASLVQLYTALVYEGFSLPQRIIAELSTHLKRDGLTHISQAIGIDCKR